MHATTLTPYAEQLLSRHSAATNPAEDEWIGSGEFAKLSGYSRRHIQTLCEQGFFKDGVEFKQRPPMPGSTQGGRIYLRRSALKKLEGA